MHCTTCIQNQPVKSCIAAMVLTTCMATIAAAQAPIHYRHRADMPPGEVGRQQLMQGGPRPGYFQPVKIIPPQGGKVGVAVAGTFQQPKPGPVTLGMQVGAVYRLQITNIPLNEGLEVYPTVEVINRLYPPQGKKAQFPIPIELTKEELEYALDGKLVTRVIYLENSLASLPVPQQGDRQRYFEADAQDDPLRVADEMGRPMAILRMGSRMPPPSGPDAAFLFNSPPVIEYPAELTERMPEEFNGPKVDPAHDPDAPGAQDLHVEEVAPEQPPADVLENSEKAEPADGMEEGAALPHEDLTTTGTGFTDSPKVASHSVKRSVPQESAEELAQEDQDEVTLSKSPHAENELRFRLPNTDLVVNDAGNSRSRASFRTPSGRGTRLSASGQTSQIRWPIRVTPER